MTTRTAIARLAERVDAIVARRCGPLWCVCADLGEGREAVARHLAEHPDDSNRVIHIVATGVASGRYGPATVRARNTS